LGSSKANCQISYPKKLFVLNHILFQQVIDHQQKLTGQQW